MRKEFSKPVKRAALKRSGGKCEAVGRFYAHLEPGQRCDWPLSYGVQFDHVVLEANSHDNSLENCAAICPSCHAAKTAKRDIPLAAKTQRQQDKHLGIRGRGGPKIKSAGFPKGLVVTLPNGMSVRHHVDCSCHRCKNHREDANV